jgi:hypothetical protein
MIAELLLVNDLTLHPHWACLPVGLYISTFENVFPMVEEAIEPGRGVSGSSTCASTPPNFGQASGRPGPLSRPRDIVALKAVITKAKVTGSSLLLCPTA